MKAVLAALLAVAIPSHAAGDDEPEEGRDFFAIGHSALSLRLLPDLATEDDHSFQLGYHVSGRVHVVGEVNDSTGHTTPDDDAPRIETERRTMLLGVRLSDRGSPREFGGLSPFIDFTAFYAQLALGGVYRKTTVDAMTDGSVAGVAQGTLGWSPLRGRDYGVGVELRAQASTDFSDHDYGFAAILLARLER